MSEEKVETIEANQWLITADNIPAYFMFKLLQGKVSVYSSGVKVNELEVKKGKEPVILGLLAALRDDRLHTASIKAETELKVVRIYMDHIRGILKNEIPEKVKKDISTAIDVVITNDKIESLKAKLAASPKVKVQIPANVSEEAASVLRQISGLYNRITGGK
jgi:predicted hotdog family 3-hydroxylacyl-ACP dehydratase